MLNEANLIGNVGRDPEIRNTQGGKMVANFSVATSFGTGDKQRTEWHRCVAWEKSAEIVQKYVKKGSKVFVRGEIRTRKWTDNAGVEKYSTEIIIGSWGTQIRVLSGGKSADEGTQSTRETEDRTEENYDDEIPF